MLLVPVILDMRLLRPQSENEAYSEGTRLEFLPIKHVPLLERLHWAPLDNHCQLAHHLLFGYRCHGTLSGKAVRTARRCLCIRLIYRLRRGGRRLFTWLYRDHHTRLQPARNLNINSYSRDHEKLTFDSCRSELTRASLSTLTSVSLSHRARLKILTDSKRMTNIVRIQNVF